MPDAPGLELIRGEIEQDHPGAVLDTSFDRDQPALVVDPAQILAVLTWLRDAPGQGYRFLSSLHAADYLPAQPALRRPLRAAEPRPSGEVESQSDARRPGRGQAPGNRLLRRSSSPPRSSRSARPSTSSAIVFNGTPDLTRILLPDDYVGWPQRRDFPVGGEPVTFTYNERNYG